MGRFEDNSRESKCSGAASGSGGFFSTTNWSVVLGAGQDDHPQAAAAMEKLCRTYWYPIYAFIRFRGSDPHQAEDLTQSFFAFLLEREVLKKVNQQKGKFRSFLLATLTNFLANERDRHRAIKRGGQRDIISLDELAAEEFYQYELLDLLTPEKLFERSWTYALLERVLGRLKQEYLAAGKAAFFAKLEPELTREVTPGLHGTLASELNMSEGAVKVALHRMRRRFGELLRQEIAQTVSSPQEVDQEIEHLFAALSSPSG